MRKSSLIYSVLLLASFTGADMAIAGKWSSASNLAYNIMGQSTTGFGNAVGSALFFDLQRQVSPSWHVGIRTSAMGVRSSRGDMYRLATGPLVRFTVWKQWALKLSAGIFNESAKNGKRELYESRGQTVQFGWERALELSDVVTVAWGGFIGKHWGNLNQDNTKSPELMTSSTNIGDYRGLQISLRILL